MQIRKSKKVKNKIKKIKKKRPKKPILFYFYFLVLDRDYVAL